MDTLLVHRLQFAFTVTYHYLFPQLTMGLALLIVVLKSLALAYTAFVYGRILTPIGVGDASEH